MRIPGASGLRGSARGRLYRPSTATQGTLPGLVLAHGLSPQGIDDLRLGRFARALAGAGLEVLTPELAALVTPRVDPRCVETLGAVVRAFATRQRRPVGLVGLSLAGGLALLAAADPQLAQHVAYVVCVGAHHNLASVRRYLRAEASGARLAQGLEGVAPEILAAVSPRGQLGRVRVPVFMLHGANDPLVPAFESVRIARELPEGTLRAFLVTPALSHVDVDRAGVTDEDTGALVEFLGGVLRQADETPDSASSKVYVPNAWLGPRASAEAGAPEADAPGPYWMRSIVELVESGNAVWAWRPIDVTFRPPGSKQSLLATFWVFVDAMKDQATGLRWPTSAAETQMVADRIRVTPQELPEWWGPPSNEALPCLLMTDRLSDARWLQARQTREIVPPHPDSTTDLLLASSMRMNRAVNGSVAGLPNRSPWVADPGKIWILHRRIWDGTGAGAVNYGWHVEPTSGPLPYTVSEKTAIPGCWVVQSAGGRHGPYHLDYSQLLMLCAPWCMVARIGQDRKVPMRTADVCLNPELAGLVTDDALPLPGVRQPFSPRELAASRTVFWDEQRRIYRGKVNRNIGLLDRRPADTSGPQEAAPTGTDRGWTLLDPDGLPTRLYGRSGDGKPIVAVLDGRGQPAFRHRDDTNRSTIEAGDPAGASPGPAGGDSLGGITSIGLALGESLLAHAGTGGKVAAEGLATGAKIGGGLGAAGAAAGTALAAAGIITATTAALSIVPVVGTIAGAVIGAVAAISYWAGKDKFHPSPLQAQQLLALLRADPGLLFAGLDKLTVKSGNPKHPAEELAARLVRYLKLLAGEVPLHGPLYNPVSNDSCKNAYLCHVDRSDPLTDPAVLRRVKRQVEQHRATPPRITAPAQAAAVLAVLRTDFVTKNNVLGWAPVKASLPDLRREVAHLRLLAGEKGHDPVLSKLLGGDVGAGQPFTLPRSA